MLPSIFERKALCIAALALGASLVAFAQPPASQTNTGGITVAAPYAGSLDPVDRKFVEKASVGGLAEVELGKLAQQRASSEQVKQFATRMVEDHTKANDELKAIAGTKGVQLPKNLAKGHQKEMAMLGRRSGSEFDREYMSHMVSDHMKDISVFESQAKSGKDADLKAFATKTLPTLQEHLKLAKNVQDTVKSSKGTLANPSTAAQKP